MHYTDVEIRCDVILPFNSEHQIAAKSVIGVTKICHFKISSFYDSIFLTNISAWWILIT